MSFRITNTKLLEECLQRIELLQMHIAAVESASSQLSRLKPYQNFKVDDGNLRSSLIVEELDEWRKLFMWTLTVDDATRERIKAAAYERFLNGRNSVAEWLNPDGRYAGGWLSSDEDEFRAMAKKAFQPKTWSFLDSNAKLEAIANHLRNELNVMIRDVDASFNEGRKRGIDIALEGINAILRDSEDVEVG